MFCENQVRPGMGEGGGLEGWGLAEGELGQGGCERRIEVFVKINKKKIRGGGGGRRVVGVGVRVNVNVEGFVKIRSGRGWGGSRGGGWSRGGVVGCNVWGRG